MYNTHKIKKDVIVLYINPYRPGAGLSPNYLAGRDITINSAKKILDSISIGFFGRSTIYYGLRGVGKTVLLNKIEDLADDLNIPCEYLEISERENFFRKDFALKVYKLINKLSFSEKIENYFKKALGMLKAFSVKYSTEENNFEIDVDPIKGIADTGNFTNDLTEILLSLGNIAAKNNKGVVILIDEIQYINEKDFESLIEALHRLNQKSYPVVIFAAGLPKIAKISGTIKSYAERLFDFIPIDSLSKSESKLALTEPAIKFSVSYTEKALNKIISITQGYPYFLQEYGKWVWELKKDLQIIDENIVNEAKKFFNKSLDASFFKVRHDRTTPRESEFIKAMVQCGELPCSTKNISDTMNESQQKISPLRAQLIHKGFIYATERGKVNFTVPQFDKFLRRTYGI